ncbi:MAG TPA: hypothetical protein VIP46_19825 [Pyrinomonadaceae bacterium]
MKNYRNVIAALALALVLLTPAHAGDGIMHTGVVAPTPTPTPVTDGFTDETSDGRGIMHTGAAEPAPPATDIMIAEAAAILARSVLALF